MSGGGYAWQRGNHGMGACMAGGMCGERGHVCLGRGAWQGEACMADAVRYGQ